MFLLGQSNNCMDQMLFITDWILHGNFTLVMCKVISKQGEEQATDLTCMKICNGYKRILVDVDIVRVKKKLASGGGALGLLAKHK